MAATNRFDEYVTINGISLGTWAAWVESYAPLLDDPPTVGENVHIPGYAGREGYGKDQDELHVTLTVKIDGDYNLANDNLSSNPRQQVLTTRAYLRDNLGTAELPNDDGTVVMVWHQPGGSSIACPVQVLGLIGFTYISPSFAVSTLDLIVPTGAFESVGS